MDITFPFGGLVKDAGYQRQRPYTTRRCVNVFPHDPLTDELRGGSRPGLIRGYDEVTSPAFSSPIRLLATCDIIDDTDQLHWIDHFRGEAMGGLWAPIATESLPDVVDDQFAAATYSGGAVTRSAFLTNPTDMAIPYPSAPTEKIGVGIFVVPYLGGHHGKYRLCLFCDNTTPNPFANGYVFELDLNGYAGAVTGTAGGYLNSNLDGSTSFSFSGLPSNAVAGWFNVLAYDSGSGLYFQVNFNGRNLGDINSATLNPSGGIVTTGRYRSGFQMVAEDADGRCQVDAFQLFYRRATSETTTRTRMIVSAGGTTKRRDRSRLESLQASNQTLNGDRLLQSVEYLQNLYIADHGGLVATGATGAFYNDGGTIRFRAGSGTYDNWVATHGIDAYDYSLRVEGATNPANNGDFSIDAITTVTDTNDTLNLTEGAWTTFVAETGLTWRVYRSPKRYVASGDTIERWRANSGRGLIPINCRGVSRHGSRMVLFGDDEAPTNIFFSAEGEPHNYAFASDDEDPTAAFAMGASTGSTIGEPVKCFITATEDVSIIGCTKSIFALRGNPMYGANDQLSDEVGIVGPDAFARTPEGPIVVMTQDGLYQISGTSALTPLSEPVLPDDLRKIDGNTFDVQMAFDIANRGIWIFVTHKFDAIGRHWFMHWRSRTLWPVAFADADLEPTAITFYKSANVDDQTVWFGCRDGYLRRPSRLSPTDDGVLIASDCWIGPLRMGVEDRIGTCSMLRGELAEASGQVDWSLHVGLTPEKAFGAAAIKSGTFDAGLNHHERPNVSGKSMYLRLQGDGDRPQPWALEQVQMTRRSRGGINRV